MFCGAGSEVSMAGPILYIRGESATTAATTTLPRAAK
jgi:hypothetical protein